MILTATALFLSVLESDYFDVKKCSGKLIERTRVSDAEAVAICEKFDSNIDVADCTLYMSERGKVPIYGLIRFCKTHVPHRIIMKCTVDFMKQFELEPAFSLCIKIQWDASAQDCAYRYFQSGKSAEDAITGCKADPILNGSSSRDNFEDLKRPDPDPVSYRYFACAGTISYSSIYRVKRAELDRLRQVLISFPEVLNMVTKTGVSNSMTIAPITMQWFAAIYEIKGKSKTDDSTVCRFKKDYTDMRKSINNARIYNSSAIYLMKHREWENYGSAKFDIKFEKVD